MKGRDELLQFNHLVDDSLLGSFSWKVATPTGSSKPAARYGHCSVVYNSTLYVLVGQDTDVDYNDVWNIAMKSKQERLTGQSDTSTDTYT